MSFSGRSDARSAAIPTAMPASWRFVASAIGRCTIATQRALVDGQAGVSSEHAERVLGHAILGVEGIYDRHRYARRDGRRAAGAGG